VNKEKKGLPCLYTPNTALFEKMIMALNCAAQSAKRRSLVLDEVNKFTNKCRQRGNFDALRNINPLKKNHDSR